MKLARISRLSAARHERSLFMIEWYSSLALRRRCQAGLNKGEAANKLKRAVFFDERGEIRDRSFESREPGVPRLGAQPRRQRHSALEHRLSRPRRLASAKGVPGHSG
jgi:hypothetical protein